MTRAGVVKQPKPMQSRNPAEYDERLQQEDRGCEDVAGFGRRDEEHRQEECGEASGRRGVVREQAVAQADGNQGRGKVESALPLISAAGRRSLHHLPIQRVLHQGLERH